MRWTPWLLTLLLLGCLPRPPARTERILAVTGAGKSLTRLTSDPADESHPAPSPTGKTLLFDVRVRDRYGNTRESTIAGIDPQNSSQRVLYTPTSSLAEHPAWMPDGNAFVFSSNVAGAWSLVRTLAASPGAAVTVLVSGEVAPMASFPAVAPDGQRLALSTEIRGRWLLATTRLDGSQLTLLGEGEQPAWSPEGKRLAFTRAVGTDYHLFLVDADSGGHVVQLTSGPNLDTSPAWSPDGKWLVFASNRGWQGRPDASQHGTRNLFAVRPDGTGLTPLTQGNAVAIAPKWAADGWVYFSSNQAGQFDLWRLQPGLE